jgi:alkanesulfonate monooxygenase SsuD/methylene tetrahydromethanopterin reductase-like flavin-dependent oxidoreductase (luciferase family)
MAISFGYGVPILANPGILGYPTPGYATLDPQTTMQAALRAEALGYDTLWVADHLMLGKGDAILEGWTVVSALAGATQRARLGVLHQSNLLRHPALAAKMAATLDQLSGGRLIYYPDAGNNAREHRAYGLPWSDDAEERMARMTEGLELTLALWKGHDPVTFTGQYYQLAGAVCAPGPLQQPHPPIWVGGVHPAILKSCAQFAQGWHSTPVGLAQLAERLAALTAACDEAGRDIAELEKALAISVLVAPDYNALRRRLRAIIALAPEVAPDADLQAFVDGASDELPNAFTETRLVGTPEEVVSQVRAYVDAGIDHFMLWFMDSPQGDSLELFAEQVLPAFAEEGLR